MLHGKKLWAYSAERPISALEAVSIEEARVCPFCQNGETHRLAEREFHEPYRWIVIGYICNSCRFVTLAKKTYV